MTRPTDYGRTSSKPSAGEEVQAIGHSYQGDLSEDMVYIENGHKSRADPLDLLEVQAEWMLISSHPGSGSTQCRVPRMQRTPTEQSATDETCYDSSYLRMG